jgi:polysaccharide pyruvyl transferase CsaB
MRQAAGNPVIGITGSYGGLNVGDEAILTAIVQELRACMPAVELVIFSRDAEHTRAQHDVDRVVARDSIRRDLIEEIERLDLLVLGGGGILYDRESEPYLHVARLAQDAGVRTATYAIGVGPLERPSEREAVAETLGRMDCITVRDAAAKQLLEEIGVEREALVTADPALLLEPQTFSDGDLHAEGIRKERPLVGVSVREPGRAAEQLEPGVYHRLLADAADFIVARFDADVVFIPMERQDIRQSHRVLADMATPERASVLRGSYEPRRVLGLMGHLEMAVGMRLHFLLFAALVNAPLMPLPYASKVSALLDRLDVPAPPPAKREHGGDLLARIDRLWDERGAQRELLRSRVPELQACAGRSATAMKEVVTDASTGAA